MEKKIFIEEIREEVTQCRIVQIDKKLNKAREVTDTNVEGV